MLELQLAHKPLVWLFILICWNWDKIRTGAGRSICTENISSAVNEFQVTVSSEVVPFTSTQARYPNEQYGWCADNADAEPYLQMDFLLPTEISKVEVGGWIDRELHGPLETLIAFGNTTGQLGLGSLNSLQMVMKMNGSMDATAMQSINLSPFITARYIRMYPLASRGNMHCLKINVIGCLLEIWSHVSLDCRLEDEDIGVFKLDRAMVSLTTVQTHYYVNTTDVCAAMCVGNRSCIAAMYKNGSEECHVYGRSKDDMPVVVTDTGGNLYGRICDAEATAEQELATMNITYENMMELPGIVTSPGYMLTTNRDIDVTWYIGFNETAMDTYPVLMFNEIKLDERTDCLGVVALDIVRFLNGVYCSVYYSVCVVYKEELLTSDFNGRYPVYIMFGGQTRITFTSKSCDRLPAPENRFRMLIGSSNTPGTAMDSSEYFVVYNWIHANIISSAFRGLLPGFGQETYVLYFREEQGLYYLTLEILQFHIQCKRGLYFSIKCPLAKQVTEDYCNLRKPFHRLTFNKNEDCEKLNVEYVYNQASLEFQEQNGFFITFSRKQFLPPSTGDEKTLEKFTEEDSSWYRTCQRDTCYYVAMLKTVNESLSEDQSFFCKYGTPASITSLQELQLSRHLLEKLSMNLTSISVGRVGFADIENVIVGKIIPPMKGVKSVFLWSDGEPVTFTAWSDNVAVRPAQNSTVLISLFRELEENNILQPLDISNLKRDTTAVMCKLQTKSNVTGEIPSLSKENSSRLQTGNKSAYFTCQSGEHVSVLSLCDVVSDCSDGSDEVGCNYKENCLGKFNCQDGGCVPFSLYCDFISDCSDGSDENKCVFPTCSEEEWRCTNGQCVPRIARCNASRECIDHSDEISCGSCDDDTSFSCGDGSCIPLERKCDGFLDCSFGRDEDGCNPEVMTDCYQWWKIGKRKSGLYALSGESDYGTLIAECNFDRAATEGKVETIFQNIDLVTRREIVSVTYEREDHIVFDYAMASMFNFELEMSCSQTAVQTCANNRKMAADYLDLAYHPEYWDCLCLQFNFDITNFFLYLTPCSNATSMLIKDGVIPDLSKRAEFEPLDTWWVMSDVRLLASPPGPQPNVFFYPGPIRCTQAISVSDVIDVFSCVRGHPVASATRCLDDYDEFGHIIGCSDLSHLQSCENFECPVDYVKCPDSFCVPVRFLCDGDKDCLHGEDEVNCNKSDCPGLYRCKASQICLPDSQVCDGRLHCPEGDDERLCDFTCPHFCNCSGYETVCRGMTSSENISAVLSPRTRFLDLSKSNVIDSFSHLNVPFLVVLNLSDCGIATVAPGAFLTMANLQVLDLRRNNLRELYDDMFEGLGNLLSLWLDGNKMLSSLIPNAFKSLSNLKFLYLANTGLEKVSAGSFSGMQMLHELHVRSGRIKSIEDDAFLGLDSLNYLDLTQNEIDSFGQGVFKGLIDLRYLRTSAYKFCCLRPGTVSKSNCFPPEDEFSSCDDLMRDLGPRILLWVVGVFALIGNSLSILYRVMLDRKKMKIGYGVFVTNLTLADALMGIYLMIIAAVDLYYRGKYIWNDDYWRNSGLCKLAGVLSTLSSEASVFFICCITLDRILVIKFPFGQWRFRPKVAMVVCVVCWLAAAMIALLPLIYREYFEDSFYSKSAVCLALPLTADRPKGWEYSIVVFVFFNFLVFILIAFGQWLIYRELQSSRKDIKSAKRRNDLSVARNLLLVVTTDFLCWFPIGVMGIMALTGFYTIPGDVYVWACVLILPVNSALNPFLYTLSAVLNKKKFSPSVDEQQRSLFVRTETWEMTWEEASRVFSVTPTISLKLYMTEKQISLADVILVLSAVTRRLRILHQRKLLQGNISLDKIHFVLENNSIRCINILVPPKPVEKDDEQQEDIRQLGILARRFINIFE